MTATELWDLLTALEDQLPLQRDLLEAQFGASFKGTVDHNKQPILVASTAQHEITLRAPKGTDEGSLSVSLASPAIIDGRTLLERYPDGHSLPPPPPGYAPKDAQGVYIANRPWGQIWFALYSGDRIVQFTLNPGRHHSPGV